MKYYLEITEENDEDSVNPMAHVLVYVKDKAEAEKELKTKKVFFEGKKYKAKYVTCNHKEGKSCTSEILEEVTK